jgi:hypothetical protein
MESLYHAGFENESKVEIHWVDSENLLDQERCAEELSGVDGIILPGGFGAAKNLCNFAFKGPDCTVQTVLTHLSGLLIAFLSGVVADRTGYHGLFIFEVILASISLIYIFYFFRKESQPIHS